MGIFCVKCSNDLFGLSNPWDDDRSPDWGGGNISTVQAHPGRSLAQRTILTFSTQGMNESLRIIWLGPLVVKTAARGLLLNF